VAAVLLPASVVQAACPTPRHPFRFPVRERLCPSLLGNYEAVGTFEADKALLGDAFYADLGRTAWKRRGPASAQLVTGGVVHRV
jgi:hypothetical protein